MTIRFAASSKRHCPVIAIRFSPPILPFAANDNGLAPTSDRGFTPASDRMIHEALRHFARHGLRAAASARENALIAQAANDSEGFDWWVSICRTLDRRMAESLLAVGAS